MSKYIALLMILLVSGCARQVAPYDYSEVDNLKGNLIVYRVPRFTDHQNDYDISINGRLVCSLQNGSYFSTTIKPKSTVVANWNAISTYIIANDGYIRIQATAWLAQSILDPELISVEKVDAERAKKEIKRFKLQHVCN